jgi:PAS domain S-box-containing protein
MYLPPCVRFATHLRLALAFGLTTPIFASQSAFAQEDPAANNDKPKPPESVRPGSVQSIPALNWFDTDLKKLTVWIMEMRRENYLIADDKSLTEKVTLVSHKPVSPEAAWQAYLSAMERHGYSIVRAGSVLKIVKANEACRALVGWAPEDLVGQDVSILMPPSDAGMHAHHLSTYLKTGKAGIIGRGREVIARRRDGSDIIIWLAIAEMRIGQQRMFTGTLRDVTAASMRSISWSIMRALCLSSSRRTR